MIINFMHLTGIEHLLRGFMASHEIREVKKKKKPNFHRAKPLISFIMISSRVDKRTGLDFLKMSMS